MCIVVCVQVYVHMCRYECVCRCVQVCTGVCSGISVCISVFNLVAQFGGTAQSLREGGFSMSKSLSLLAHCTSFSGPGELVVASLHWAS